MPLIQNSVLEIFPLVDQRTRLCFVVHKLRLTNLERAKTGARTGDWSENHPAQRKEEIRDGEVLAAF